MRNEQSNRRAWNTVFRDLRTMDFFECRFNAGVFDGPETDFLYRSKIHAAISSLPLDQRRVVELFLKDIPIDPQGTDTMTMVKILGCCEKTVRNRLKRAFARLAELLKEEDA